MKMKVIEIKCWKISVEKYPNKIGPYLKDIISNLKKSDCWKIQLTIVNNFISCIDNDEEHAMHSKGDNIQIIINDKVDEVIIQHFDSLKKRYRNNLEPIKGSEFVFDYVNLLYYKCHKINPNPNGGSYIDSLDKKQKSNNKSYQ